MGPLDLTAQWGSTLSYLVPLLIGVGFGASLEASGFGDSRKLAAQFYLKDMTVLKVMFTAIVVAATLIFSASAFGLLEFDRVYVNHTYLLPGVVGGLIMGVGFVVGGFCPGTSMVAAATLKLDGVAFVLGAALGVFAFGETVHLFDGFWNSTALGRLTMPDHFGVDAGVVLVAVVLMALFMFLVAEISEAYFGRGVPSQELRFFPRRRVAWVGGGVLLAISLAALVKGQPTPTARWDQMAATAGPNLTSRAVYAHPQEVAQLSQDVSVYTRVIDVRSEAHFNLFHLRHAINATFQDLVSPAFVKPLKAAPPNTAVFVVSNDETDATRAWKLLYAQGVPNLYIVEGGINGWLKLFPPPPCLAKALPGKHQDEGLAFDFFRAVGDCCNQAYPEVRGKELPLDCYLASNPDNAAAHSAAGKHSASALKPKFVSKVKLKKKAAVKGGCG